MRTVLRLLLPILLISGCSSVQSGRGNNPTENSAAGNDIPFQYVMGNIIVPRALRLEPGKDGPFETNIRTFGFLPAMADGKVKVAGVHSGSPAETAGMRPGTDILSAEGKNGIPVRDCALMEFLVRNDEDTLRLEIGNREGRRKVILNKAPLLPEPEA